MNKIKEEILELINKEIDSWLLPPHYKIITKEIFPEGIPSFDELTWPSKSNYAYVFPIDPNEEVKICYYGEEEND